MSIHIRDLDALIAVTKATRKLLHKNHHMYGRLIIKLDRVLEEIDNK